MGNLIGGAILVGFGYWYIYLTPDNCCSNDITKPPNNEIVPNNNNNIHFPTNSIQNVETGENYVK